MPHQTQNAILTELIQLQKESMMRDDDFRKEIQQKINVVLTQIYELHEYETPRLFVVLPIAQAGVTGSSSLLNCMPQLTEKFRLFFLCECDEHSRADSDKHGEFIDSTTHFAPHDGYDLDCPTDFFNRYAPYLLGMLRILRTSLIATSIAAPAVGHLVGDVDQVASATRSTAASTIVAVNASIQSLENTLNKAGKSAEAQSTASATIDRSGFKGLRALQGPDLRTLSTYLKDKDKGNILGNLFKITTKDGHVKWVCLNHNPSTCREDAMNKFLETVKLFKGEYDSQNQKIVIRLDSGTNASKFFSQLERSPFVNEIHIEFTWEFSPDDLKLMVQTIKKSNIRICRINLNESKGRGFSEKLPLGTYRYESLLELLATVKIQSVHLTGLTCFGKRSQNFPKGTVCSTLTLFEYEDVISEDDQARLASILQACQHLVVLRLGHSWIDSVLTQEITDKILGLGNLKVLRLFHCSAKSKGSIKKFLGNFPKSQELRELVLRGGSYVVGEIYKVVRAMAPWEKLDLKIYDLDMKRIATITSQKSCTLEK
ncbi:hypothetical protein BGZ74_010998 [Mortierella antarctica]|nr:hypothetical protein BGZ74_010998 [Mortierella antarctica]